MVGRSPVKPLNAGRQSSGKRTVGTISELSVHLSARKPEVEDTLAVNSNRSRIRVRISYLRGNGCAAAPQVSRCGYASVETSLDSPGARSQASSS